MLDPQPLNRYRSIFLSDVHLGYHGCRAEALLNFLRHARTENLYLVGDIVDLVSLNRNFFWPQTHSDVIRTLLGKAKHATRIVYIPGNHDAMFRDYCGLRFGNVEVRRRCIHVTATGRRYLVTHGDEFDADVRLSPWKRCLGAFAYRRLMYINSKLNEVRQRLGCGYWSLASFLKSRSGSARRYIERYRKAAVFAATQRGLHGIICGHIHRPDAKLDRGIEYLNDGDWVEHCTALVEHLDGRLELLRWDEDAPAFSAAADVPLDVEPA